MKETPRSVLVSKPWVTVNWVVVTIPLVVWPFMNTVETPADETYEWIVVVPAPGSELLPLIWSPVLIPTIESKVIADVPDQLFLSQFSYLSHHQYSLLDHSMMCL